MLLLLHRELLLHGKLLLLKLLRNLLNRLLLDRHLLDRHLGLLHRQLRLSLLHRHLRSLHVLLTNGELLSDLRLLDVALHLLLQLLLCDLLQLLLLLHGDSLRCLYLLLIPVGRRGGDRRSQILNNDAKNRREKDRERNEHQLYDGCCPRWIPEACCSLLVVLCVV